ncbi:hypothetical protein BOSE21B_100311 [Bosea sp. 21B]|nr:hypothetical protein BOSE21B_100311 [Bosea sp. 21B]VXC91385.1 hypothetical protein BOSE127_80001 [Bosea sp. 127]
MRRRRASGLRCAFSLARLSFCWRRRLQHQRSPMADAVAMAMPELPAAAVSTIQSAPEGPASMAQVNFPVAVAVAVAPAPLPAVQVDLTH